MLIRHRGYEPACDASAFVAPTAVLAGRVRVGPRSRIMYGAVLDSEGSAVSVGECVVICENSVLRATEAAGRERPVTVGDNAFIGPHATLLGCWVGACAYIATGATVLQGAVVGSGAVVAVGALVHAGAVVPEGFFLPPYTVAVGEPLRLYGPEQREALAEAIRSVGFPRAAFGLEPGGFKDRASLHREIAEVRSREFESHLFDVVL